MIDDADVSINIVQSSQPRVKKAKRSATKARALRKDGKPKPGYRSHAASNRQLTANLQQELRLAHRRDQIARRQVEQHKRAQQTIASEFDSGIQPDKQSISKPSEPLEPSEPSKPSKQQPAFKPVSSQSLASASTSRQQFSASRVRPQKEVSVKETGDSREPSTSATALIRPQKLAAKSDDGDRQSQQQLISLKSRYDDEFSDGLASARAKRKLSTSSSPAGKSRPGQAKKRAFLSDEEYFAKREQELEKEVQQMSAHEKEHMRDEFKKMFATKGVANFDAADKDSFIRGRRKDSGSAMDASPSFKEKRQFVASVFRNNPDIPSIKLSTLCHERREGVFSGKQFDSLKDALHPHLISCIENRLNINQMTFVQAEAIPAVLSGNDCQIKSVTGSGKTLAMLCPIVQMLQRQQPEITRSDGTFALIIEPTRELVAQVYETLSMLCKSFNRICPGYLMGGESKHSEKGRIRKGINILVSTPGRLLDHLSSTQKLSLCKLQFLVIDEADRLYESGFEESVKRIVQAISEAKAEGGTRPQTILASATLSEGVRELAGMVLENAEFIDTGEQGAQSGRQSYTLPENLEQSFCIVPAKLRILAVSGFILQHCSYESSSKMLIFMSTQDVVDFHHTLLKTVFNRQLEQSDLSVVQFFKLHGNMDQAERTKIFNEFRQVRSGVLLCTDVASRGIDLPQVNWVLQYSCPLSIEDYIHRVGRTARVDQLGKSVILLLPSEIKYVRFLQHKLKANLLQAETEKSLECMTALDFEGKNSRSYREQAAQLQFVYESATAEDAILLDLAKKAYLSYTRAYASYPRAMKELLPFKELHLGHLCKSFCLRESPRALGAGYRPAVRPNEDGKGRSRQLERKFGKLGAGGKEKRPFRRLNLPTEMKISEFDSGL